MIGFRGASRYYDPRYAEGFALECEALLRVRRDMGLTNVKVMIPFCRTVEEGRRVIAMLGATRPASGRGRARRLRDVRDSVERGPRGRLSAGVRRVLDRIERPDPAHAGTRSRLGFGRAPVRRAQRRRAMDDRARHRGRAPRRQSRSASAARRPRTIPSSRPGWSGSASTRCRSIRTWPSRRRGVSPRPRVVLRPGW